ncbi:MAG TPA: IS982 family transposase [Terriglobia bacterium]|nr:IS982 family transposase [Terriglobia bacterium]
MDANLDLLLTVVYCIADDFLPKRAGNARRRITDAEVVALCVAQAIMGIPSDPRFLAVAVKRLAHLFPVLPARDAFHKRRLRLSPQIEALIAHFARQSPGFFDDLLLVDSTPVECARSRETVKRGGVSSLTDALANAADYGYCASHSRFFWGFRLHALFALDGTPRALALTSPKVDEKLVCVQMVARAERQPGQMMILIGDKNFRGKDFEAELATLDAQIIRPRRKDERGRGPHLAPIRQRIESIFQTCKDIFTLERHGARTLENLRVRLCARFAALAAAISLNHQLGRPSRSIACYIA